MDEGAGRQRVVRQAACRAGAEVAELAADRHPERLDVLEAGAVSGMPAEQPAVPAFGDVKQLTLPSGTVVFWVASVAHGMFGATVMMCRAWAASARVRMRGGESRAFSRTNHSTRLRDTRMPSIARNRAQILR
jgi:hypothetical protein